MTIIPSESKSLVGSESFLSISVFSVFLGDKAVADPVDRQDQLRILRVGLDLLSQSLDMGVDRARQALVGDAPQGFLARPPSARRRMARTRETNSRGLKGFMT